MIASALQLVPVYGLWLVGISTFLSCLAVPIPSSLIMLTAGAFVAAGDLSGPATAATALAGAVIGDQVGYAMGRRGSRWLTRSSGKSAKLIDRAQILTDNHGGWAVFLSRWLLSPLGPYVNLATGVARMNWLRFTLWDIAGEAVWVTLYLGAGYVFAGRIEAVAEITGTVSGTLAAGAITIGLGLWLAAVVRADRKRKTGQMS